ncbi:hypothetical protein C2G38_2171508 [Gigaspora rosea]|uniref:Uncharacterized protein n=1 Tax=Gigaspora rosea TaxID=44941 RepID=A0A397VLM2_9GLOM|nr:hypothetical protein C2G38_2171508 [Gigaspora rosea]
MTWSNFPQSPLTELAGQLVSTGQIKIKLFLLVAITWLGIVFSSIYDITDTTMEQFKRLGTMKKLNTSSSNWTESSRLAVSGVQSYGSVLLNNTSIFYIGGSPGDTPNITL